MKTTDSNQKKQLTELSDEELKQVTGGASIDCSLPENKDKFQCSDKFKGLDVVFQGVNMNPNPVDFKVITASRGWDDVIE